MPNKCKAFNCKEGYLSKDKQHSANNETPLTKYAFPNPNKGAAEEARYREWLRKVNRANLVDGEEPENKKFNWRENWVLCERHFDLENVELKKVGSRLTIPNHIFPTRYLSSGTEENTSCDATPSAKKRKSNTSENAGKIKIQPDQLNDFNKLDHLPAFDVFQDQTVSDGYYMLQQKTHGKEKGQKEKGLISFINAMLVIQSIELVYGVPKFLIKIKEDFTFECYHLGCQVFLKCLTNNRITQFRKRTQIDAALEELSKLIPDEKTNSLLETIYALGGKKVGEKKFTPDIIIKAYSIFRHSRVAYQYMRDRYGLPSVKTLTRFTSKCAKLDETAYIKQVFKNEPFETPMENQRLAIIMHDEVYIKKQLLYHGGTIFGLAADNVQKLASKVLAVMINCILGGPKFLSKMIPIDSLKQNFLNEIIKNTIVALQNANVQPKVVISDGLRTNKAFVKLNTLEDECLYGFYSYYGLEDECLYGFYSYYGSFLYENTCFDSQ